MKLYVMSVICITAVGMLVSMLSPDGEGGGLSRNVRLVYGICVVFVCIYPINNIVIAVKELDFGLAVEAPEQNDDKYKDILESSYSAAEVESLKNGIKQILNDRFDIDSSECKVEVSFAEQDGGSRALRRVLITLYGSAIWKDTGEIEAVLGGMLACEIVTAIG